MSSVKRSIFANTLSQAYVAVIGICLLPYYMKLLGQEAYGLVAFFSTVQYWTQILDMGITPAIAREVSSCRATNPRRIGHTVAAFEKIFVVVGIVIIVVLLAMNQVIATSWLNIDRLASTTVSQALALIALGVGVRWMGGVYRGAVLGHEEIVWLSKVSVACATLRFVAVIPLLMVAGKDVTLFLGWQLLILVAELMAFKLKSRALVRRVSEDGVVGMPAERLVPGLLRTAFAIGLTSGIWTVITQSDRLLLSKYLAISEFGVFTIVVTAASGVMMLTNPIATTLMPRLTFLYASGMSEDLKTLYGKSTQMATVFGFGISLVVAAFARDVLYLWTGNETLAANYSSILTFYALGYGILVVSAFPYYLQYATNNLKLHVLGSLFFLAVFVPGMLFAYRGYGIVGVAVTWLAVNAAYFLLWCGVVHRRLLGAFHLRWLVFDFARIAVPATVACVVLVWLTSAPAGRIALFAYLSCVSMLVVGVAALASPAARSVAVQLLKRYR